MIENVSSRVPKNPLLTMILRGAKVRLSYHLIRRFRLKSLALLSTRRENDHG